MISFTITIAKEFIQQQRWFQEKFYSIKKNIVEQVIMNTENSRKASLQEIDFEVRDSVLLT